MMVASLVDPAKRGIAKLFFAYLSFGAVVLLVGAMWAWVREENGLALFLLISTTPFTQMVGSLVYQLWLS